MKAALSGLLAPTLRETMLGNAQILELFNISKVGVVAGCRVTDGGRTVQTGPSSTENPAMPPGSALRWASFDDSVRARHRVRRISSRL